MSASADLVKIIHSAHRRNTEPSRIRRRLTKAGVSKGTVSKCITVLVCLNQGTFTPDDFTSLSGGYQLAQVSMAAQGFITDGTAAPLIRPVINLGFQKP